MEATIISEKLRGLRAEKRLSLEQMAEKLNIHRETFRKYENNPFIMDVGMFIEILEIYGVEANIFFENIMANSHKN